jgi:hypothetical protein
MRKDRYVSQDELIQKLFNKIDEQGKILTELKVSQSELNIAIKGNGTRGINDRLKIVEKAVLVLFLALIMQAISNPEVLAVIQKVF